MIDLESDRLACVIQLQFSVSQSMNEFLFYVDIGQPTELMYTSAELIYSDEYYDILSAIVHLWFDVVLDFARILNVLHYIVSQ